MTQSNLAHCAPNPRTHKLFTKGWCAMRNIFNTLMTGLMAFALSLIPFTTTGCGDYDGTLFTSPPVGAEMEYPDLEVCDPEVCDTPLCVQLSMDLGDGTKPYSSTKCFEREADASVATIMFDPLPSTAGQNLPVQVHLKYVLPSGHETLNQSGKTFETFHEIGPLAADEAMHLFKMRIVDTSTGVTGSGLGGFYVKTMKNGELQDKDDCTYKVAGNLVTPDADDDEDYPDGALLKDLTKGASVVAVECGEATGDQLATVVEDHIVDVTVTITEPTSTTENEGDLLAKVKDSQNNALEDCEEFNFFQLVTNPIPTSDVSGDYLFKGIKAGVYDVLVTCGQLSGQRKVEVVAQETQVAWFTLASPVSTGTLCIGKNGLPLDWFYTSADMGMWIGYVVNGTCVPASPAELLTMSVTGVVNSTGPSCADSSCAIEVTELVVTPNWSSYAPDEQRIFEVTVSDGSQTVVVFIDTVNGEAFQPPQ